MELVVDAQGQVRCVYDEAINLHALGAVAIERASHVESDPRGRWLAQLSPVGGPTLGPFSRRSDALAAEATWLRRHWLVPDADVSSVSAGAS